MKITRQQLRRIIREEKQKLHELEEYRPPLDTEGNAPGAADISRHLARLHGTIDALFELMEPYELALELEGIAADLKSHYG